MKKIRHLIEYAFVRFFLALIDLLPLGVSTWIASRLADIIFAAATRRRAIACDNIRRSGVAKDEKDVRRIAKESFRHFSCLLVDTLKADRYLTDDGWQDHVEMDVAPETYELVNKPDQPVILISGHLGNWEVAARIVSYMKPVVGIARKMNNPYVDRLIQKRKPTDRFKLTPKHDADMGRFISTLRDGNVLAMLIDQHAREGGMMIDFFGHPASTHRSYAMLHLITKIPICFGYCVKTGPKRFKFKAIAPLAVKKTGNRDADVKSILEKLTAELEEAIRAYPEQYLWAHRRWR
jgi:KDO2-lipid IV(A) lauroyltransferase